MPNPVGRPDAGVRKTVNFRIPEAQQLQLFLLKPEMLHPNGGVRYGAWQEYLMELLLRDLARMERDRLQQGVRSE